MILVARNRSPILNEEHNIENVRIWVKAGHWRADSPQLQPVELCAPWLSDTLSLHGGDVFNFLCPQIQ